MACFLGGVPVGPLFFTFTSGYANIMSFTAQCGSGAPWYPTEEDCEEARDVCGRGVARCDRLFREDDWGGGVGSGSCGGGGLLPTPLILTGLTCWRLFVQGLFFLRRVAQRSIFYVLWWWHHGSSWGVLFKFS